MSRRNYLFTSESVSEGHPDKVCDRISDAVVDLYLAAYPFSRVAIETLVTTNRIVMAGEVRGPEEVTPEKIEAAARRAVREIGYEQKGFHWKNAEFQFYVHEQSADIARGVRLPTRSSSIPRLRASPMAIESVGSGVERSGVRTFCLVR